MTTKPLSDFIQITAIGSDGIARNIDPETLLFGYFVTYYPPTRPVQYWNRKLKLWTTERTADCLYTTRLGANIGLSAIQNRYSASELARECHVEYLSYPNRQKG